VTQRRGPTSPGVRCAQCLTGAWDICHTDETKFCKGPCISKEPKQSHSEAWAVPPGELFCTVAATSVAGFCFRDWGTGLPKMASTKSDGLGMLTSKTP
jgi:hypothetical protein